MKLRGHYLVLLVPIVLTLGCGQGAEQAEDQTIPADETTTMEADIAAFRTHVREWDAALTTGSGDAAAALFGANPVVMPPYQPARVGAQDIAAFFEEFFAQGTLMLVNTEKDIYIADDISLSHGTYTLTIEGEETTEDVGKWINIAQKQVDGSFKTIRTLWNTDIPIGGSPPPGAEAIGVGATAPEIDSSVCAASHETVTQSFIDAFVAGDVETVTALHTENTLRLPPGMEAFQGRADLAAYFQSYVDNFETRELTLSDESHLVAGDRAASSGAFQFAYTPTGGGETIAGVGKYLIVSQLGDDGCWRADWVIWNGNDPPPDTGVTG